MSTESPDREKAVAGAPASPRWAMVIALLLIASGVALRVRVYLIPQSLWWDEAMLADNIARRSYGELLGQLDHHQTAPAGFLLLAKTSVRLFGLNEYAMHLVPLLSAVAALPLFWLLARRVLGVRFGVAALALFAITRHLSCHAAEFKQYSSDALVAVALLLLGVRAYQEGLTRGRCVWLGAAGAVAVWCSHPSVFVLACVGVMLGFDALRRGDRRALRALAVVGAAWVASFAAEYLLILRHGVADGYLQRFWGFTFAPLLPPRNYAWFQQCLLHMFSYPGGFSEVALAALVFAFGLVGLGRRDRRLLIAAAGPIGVAVLASAVQVYPFFERLLMFAAPGMLLVIVAGVAHVWGATARTGRRLLVGPIVLVAVLLGPAADAVRSIVQPPGKGPSDLMPAMPVIRAEWRDGDVIYAHWASVFAVRYYSEHTEHLPAGIRIVESVRPPYEVSPKYADDLRRLAGQRRVWVITGNLSHQRFLAVVAAGLGKVLRRVEPPGGVTVLLVDLGQAAGTTMPTTTTAPAGGALSPG